MGGLPLAVALLLLVWTAILLTSSCCNAFQRRRRSRHEHHRHVKVYPGLLLLETTAFNGWLYSFGRRHRRFLGIWFTVGSIVGVLGMILASGVLLWDVTLTSFSAPPLRASLTSGGAIGAEGGGSLDISWKIVTPVVPGLNLPWADVGYLWTATATAMAVHELGHSLAAASEGVRTEHMAMFLLVLFPGALVALNSEALEDLPPARALRVYCAGIWHNVMTCGMCWLFLTALPTLLSPIFATGEGPLVVSILHGSPMERHLSPGDSVVALDDLPIRTIRDWNDRLSRMALSLERRTRATVPHSRDAATWPLRGRGYCVPWRHLSLKNVTLPSPSSSSDALPPAPRGGSNRTSGADANDDEDGTGGRALESFLVRCAGILRALRDSGESARCPEPECPPGRVLFVAAPGGALGPAAEIESEAEEGRRPGGAQVGEGKGEGREGVVVSRKRVKEGVEGTGGGGGYCLSARDVAQFGRCGRGWLEGVGPCSEGSECLEPLLPAAQIMMKVAYRRQGEDRGNVRGGVGGGGGGGEKAAGLGSDEARADCGGKDGGDCPPPFLVFGGYPGELATAVPLSDYRPRLLWGWIAGAGRGVGGVLRAWEVALLWLPPVVEKAVTYLFHVSVALALLNISPVFYLDGEPALEALISLACPNMHPAKQQRILRTALWMGTCFLLVALVPALVILVLRPI